MAKDVASIIRNLRSESQITKEAQAKSHGSPDKTEDLKKEAVAQNLIAGGKLFAYGIVGGLQEKVATAPIGASGQASPSQGNESNDDSMMKRIADKVMSFKGHVSPGSSPSVPGSNPNVVAETVEPAQAAKPNQDEPTGG